MTIQTIKCEDIQDHAAHDYWAFGRQYHCDGSSLGVTRE